MRVWAPRADHVELVVGDERIAMASAAGGWHEASVELVSGTDYWYSLDGAAPLPDPRSRWQPDGVRGASRVVDDDAFAWTDSGWDAGQWLASGVMYELHVGTFSRAGTFDGVIEHLDHLAELGVTAIEVMPVAEFPGVRGWGYDGVDLWAPHSAYGGPEGFKRMVDACHSRGLAVILDVVYNHLGPAGNNLARFGPYFTDRYATPWGDAVNLDGPDSDEVRAFFLDNAEMWLRHHHLDGLRLDAVHAIVDTSAVHFLEELAERVEVLSTELGRSITLIAESDLNDPRVIRRRDVGGYGMDAQWSDDFHHALHVALTGERDGYYADFGSLADLARALERGFVYDGRYSAHRRRRHGRAVHTEPSWRLVGYLQNHDQVGNRATGERSSMLVGRNELMAAAALVLLGPFVPMLFQGEEWGASTPFQYFTDHDDAELGRAVSEGRRAEFSSFGWSPESVPDPQDPATFESSRLDWDERDTGEHGSLLGWHRALVSLRSRQRPAASGRFARCSFDEEARWFVMRCGTLAVVCNLGDAAVEVAAGPDPGEVLLSNVEGVAVRDETALLPAGAVVVLGMDTAAKG